MEAEPVLEEGTAPGSSVIQTSAALVGDGADIAQARQAVAFLTRVPAEYGLPVSERAMDLTYLVVSELVTNARNKYAPGPILLDLCIVGDLVEVVVWDCDPVLPIAQAADAGRVSTA